MSSNTHIFSLFLISWMFFNFSSLQSASGRINHTAPAAAQQRQPVTQRPAPQLNKAPGAQQSAAPAADENATLQGRWAKGPTLSVAVGSENDVYFGDGAEFVSATISSSGAISKNGSVVLPGPPNDIEVSSDGNYAYVAMGYEGVAVVDIRSASGPQLVNVLTRPDEPFEAKAVSQWDDRLYIAAGYQGLLEARIFNADSIVFGGVYKYDGCVINDVTARNDTLFTASNNNALEMLYYSGGQFHLLNQVNYNKYTDSYQSQTPFASSVFWQHDSLFVADSWTGLFFFTVEDTALTFSGVGLGACTHVAAKGDYVYTTDYYKVNVLFNGEGKPMYRDSRDVPTSMQLAIWQDYVLVAGKSRGLYTFDISDPLSFNDGDFFATSSLTYDVFQRGYYLYRITPVNTLDIISVFNPADPHTVAQLELGSADEEAHKIYVDGDTAFVYSYNFKTGASTLHFIDVSDPSAPQLLTSWSYPSATNSFYDIVPNGKVLYAAMGADIVAIDFSDLANIHETGHVTTSGWAEDLAVQGNYLFTASEDAGMCVIDISNPASPQEKTTFRESDMDYYTAIRIQGDYAYIADSWVGLKIINISNPLAPVLSGSFTDVSGDFYADRVAVSGNYAYTQGAWGEVLFINIGDPAHPRLAGSYHVSGVSTLSAYSRMVYIGETTNGIYAVSNDNPDALLPCHYAGEVSGEWTCTTIYLEGDVTIPAGDTLRISESVEKVAVLGPYQIKVQGVLLAGGPENDVVDLNGEYILFQGNNWHGIYFNNLNETGAGTSVIENCRFDYADKMDMSYQGGGAIALYNSDKVIIRNSVFYRNTARLGGAIYMEDSNPVIENCYFEINGRGGVNTSEIYSEGGGAMFIKHSAPYLHRLQFYENGAHSGGAMVIDGCSPTLSNALFVRNISDGLAGCVAVTSDNMNPASPKFVNITSVENEAVSGGTFQLMGPQTHPEIINSVLYDNAKPEIYINDGTPTVTYSLVDSAGTESWFGQGCLEGNPRFEIYGDRYHLESTACGDAYQSIAIDAGHPDSVDTYLDVGRTLNANNQRTNELRPN